MVAPQPQLGKVGKLLVFRNIPGRYVAVIINDGQSGGNLDRNILALYFY